jgi:hypothetical protein
LVRPAVVVVLDPRLHPLLRLLEAVELRAGKEVRPDRLPESLNLTQGLRMMRSAAEVMDPVLLEFRFKPRLPAPVGVLPAIVRQHLLGQAILAHRPPIYFQHMLGRLTAIKTQPHQIAGVIVHEPNQVGVLTTEANRANVALPHLIGRRPLEEPRLGRILNRLAPVRLDQLLLVQHAPHGLATDRQQQPPMQPLADLLHAKARLLLL